MKNGPTKTLAAAPKACRVRVKKARLRRGCARWLAFDDAEGTDARHAAA